MMKTLVTLVVVFVLLALGGAYYLGSNLDKIIKAAVETYGTQAAQAETTLQNVRISLSSGEGVLEGFRLGNPKGFSDGGAISFARVDVKVDPKSFTTGGAAVIREVTIDQPLLTYEVLKSGESNLLTLQRNITAYAATISGKKKEAQADVAVSADSTKKNAPTMIIEKLVIRNGEIKIAHEMLADKGIVAKLPVIEMANVGKDSGGLSPEALAQLILNKLITTAVQAGQADLIEGLRTQAVDSLKSAVQETDIGKGGSKALGGILGQ